MVHSSRWFRICFLIITITMIFSSGCTGPPIDNSPETAPNTTRSPNQNQSPSPDTLERLQDEPHADHSIYVVNKLNHSVNVTLFIERFKTGEVIYNHTWTQSPNSKHEVYNLAQIDPRGVEKFRVVFETNSEQSGELILSTNACQGDAFFTVDEEGELHWDMGTC